MCAQGRGLCITAQGRNGHASVASCTEVICVPQAASCVPLHARFIIIIIIISIGACSLGKHSQWSEEEIAERARKRLDCLDWVEVDREPQHCTCFLVNAKLRPNFIEPLVSSCCLASVQLAGSHRVQLAAPIWRLARQRQAELDWFVS